MLHFFIIEISKCRVALWILFFCSNFQHYFMCVFHRSSLIQNGHVIWKKKLKKLISVERFGEWKFLCARAERQTPFHLRIEKEAQNTVAKSELAYPTTTAGWMAEMVPSTQFKLCRLVFLFSSKIFKFKN